jgi:hypothetical protein
MRGWLRRVRCRIAVCRAPVYVLPFKTQVFTRAHTSRERDREYWSILCALCGREQRPRLIDA